MIKYKDLTTQFNCEFFNFIQNKRNKSWDWDCISQNLNITWEIILHNPDKPWEWSSISRNKNITWEIIKNNPDNLWNWMGISHHPNITWEIIQNNPDNPWDWYCISRNQNITWEIIQNNPDNPWNWCDISDNPMTLGKEKWISDYRLKIITTLRIQRYWRYYSCNPKYKLAIKLIHNKLQ